MTVNSKVIDEIIHRVLSVIPAERIILMGSAAMGMMTCDSDIDLLILEPSTGNVMGERARVYDQLRGLGYPFDIIIMSKDRFEESKHVVGGIAYPANKYGKVIYEAA